jgi:hypothetical protein
MSGYAWTLYAIFATAVVSWVIGLKHFLVVSTELTRAREAGEASHIPSGGGRGIPVVVILTENALPRVEKDRKKLVRVIVLFFGLCGAGALLIAIFGPIH